MRFAFRRQQDCMKRNQTPRAPWLLKLLQNDLIIIFLVVAPTYQYCNTFTLCFSGELSCYLISPWDMIQRLHIFSNQEDMGSHSNYSFIQLFIHGVVFTSENSIRNQSRFAL